MHILQSQILIVLIMLIMLNHSKSFQLKMVVKRNPFIVQSSAFKQSAFKLKESVSPSVTNYLQSHQEFLKDVAKVDVPKRLETLLELLSISDDEELVSPRSRSTLNPFLIPLSKSKIDNSMLSYIRWPTQKDEMDLQLVRSTDCGMRLVSLSTDHYCHRLAVELDFKGNKKAQFAIDLLNSHGELYKTGDFLTLLKSGKFPAITEEDLRLILDRYLLLKVGGFPDCYERLATNFLNNNNDVSALVTCERAVNVFYSWGHPIHFHTKMLNTLGREKEAKDSARASMGMPKFTIGNNLHDIEDAIKCAGFTGSEILGDMHAFRATDPRLKDIEEGHSPIQIILDQAGHLMDAVTLGAIKGGWENQSNRIELAKRYRDSGYPDIAIFIETIN